MKRIKKIFKIALVFFLILTTSACVNIHKGETFEKFSNDFFLSIIGFDEITINSLFKDREALGFEHYDPTLPEPYVPDGSGGSIVGDFLGVSVQGYLNRLNDFDFDLLTKDEQVTYLIIKDVLERSNQKETYMYYLDSSYLGSYLGYQAQLPLLFAEYSFYDVDDIESYLKIVNLVEPTFKKYYQFEIEKAEVGYGMPDFVIDKVIAQCENITNDIDNHFLIPVFNDKVDNLDYLSETDKNRYKTLHESAIKGSFFNGYIYLKEHLPNLKGLATNDQGLFYYEGGQEFYQFLFNQVTGYDIRVEDALSYLEENLRKRIISYVTLLQTNERLGEEMENTILMDFESPIDLINFHQEKIKSSFPSIDNYDIDISVKYIHESMEDNFSPAAYVISPIDETSFEFIYLNNKSVNDRFNYLFVTLAHEGFPGHLYQNVYFKNQEVNIIRKVLRNIGYVEGWATYAEMYSYQFSDANPIVIQALKLNDEINGILTAILDIAIHYYGYSVTDIINYLEANVGPANPNVDYQALFQQLVEVPTNSQQYFFTYLKFVDMYEKTQKTLKENFDEMEYHKLILDLGPIPLKFVEVEVNKYLDLKTK